MKIIFENGMYAAVAESGMVIDYGSGCCKKLYRKKNDFSDCIEIEQPVENDEELTDSEALSIILGGHSV